MNWTLHEIDPHSQEWSDFLETTDHLLFHQPMWAKVLHEGVSSRIFCFILKKDGVAQAGAIGFILGKFGIRIAYCSYPYGSLIGRPPESRELEELLRSFCKNHGVCQIQLVGYPYAPHLKSQSFTTQQDSSHIVELAGLSPDSLWKSYRRSRRQDIRKAQERGITVCSSQDNFDIHQVHRFYLETMNRTGGVARYRKNLLVSIVKNLGPSGRAKLYLAKHNGHSIAGMLIVYSKQFAHGLLLASSDEGLKLQPNKLLLHTATSECTERGLQGFDYMPSGQSSNGVSNFKKLWKAEEVGIEHHTLVSSPWRSRIWRTAFGLAKLPPMRNVLSVLRKIT